MKTSEFLASILGQLDAVTAGDISALLHQQPEVVAGPGIVILGRASEETLRIAVLEGRVEAEPLKNPNNYFFQELLRYHQQRLLGIKRQLFTALMMHSLANDYPPSRNSAGYGINRQGDVYSVIKSIEDEAEGGIMIVVLQDS